MMELLVETVCALILSINFFNVLWAGRQGNFRPQNGWPFILAGFGLLLLGMLFDLTDNFPSLNRYLIIGNTPHQAFIKNVLGYFLGFLFLAIGLWKWLPLVILVHAREGELKKVREDLEERVKERTAQLESANQQLEREIGERRQAEAALRESLGRFEAMVTNTPLVAIQSFDEQGRIRTWNAVSTQLYGYSPAEAQGRRLQDLILDESSAVHFEGILAQIFASGRAAPPDEWPVVRKDGKPLWVYSTMFPYLAGGAVSEVFCMDVDITHLKWTEAELRRHQEHLEKLVAERTAELTRAYVNLQASEARYRLLAENITDVIWTMDLNLRFTFLSPSVKQLRGFSPQETMGQPLEAIFPPASLELIRQVLSEEVQREQGGQADPARVREFEIEVFHRDGSTLWVEVRSGFLRNLELEAIGIMGVARDISRRRQAEIALRESEGRFRAIFRGAPIGIVLGDLEGRLLEANPTARKILERPPGNLPYFDPALIHPDDAPKFAEVRQRLQNGDSDPGELELRLQRADGGWAWGRLHLTLIRESDGEGQYVLGMIEDITQLKQGQEEIASYQESLRLLASELTLTEARERRRLAEDLHDHIGQILALAQIKLGSLAGNPLLVSQQDELRDIRELLKQAIQSTRSLTFELGSPILYELGLEEAVQWLAEDCQRRYGLDIEVKKDTLARPLEEAPSILLFRALQELLANIFKHAQAQRVCISIQGAGDELILQVSDDGVGFDAAAVGPPWHRQLGFGLFSIRERLSQLGGDLAVFSRPGEGTTVRITLPLPGAETEEHRPAI